MHMWKLSPLTRRVKCGGNFGLVQSRAFSSLGVKAHLSVLGLDQSATLTDVRSAYLQQAKRSHPDVGGDERHFIKIKTAYDFLTAYLSNNSSTSSSRDTNSQESRSYTSSYSSKQWYDRYTEDDDADERFWEKCYSEWRNGQSHHQRDGYEGHRSGNRHASRHQGGHQHRGMDYDDYNQYAPPRGDRNHRERDQDAFYEEYAKNSKKRESSRSSRMGSSDARKSSRHKNGEHSSSSSSSSSSIPQELRIVVSPLSALTATNAPSPAGIFTRIKSALINGQPVYERIKRPFFVIYYSKKGGGGEWTLAQSLKDEGKRTEAPQDGCNDVYYSPHLMGEYECPSPSTDAHGTRATTSTKNAQKIAIKVEAETDMSSSDPSEWSTDVLLHFCKTRSVSTAGNFVREDLIQLVREVHGILGGGQDSDFFRDSDSEGPDDSDSDDEYSHNKGRRHTQSNNNNRGHSNDNNTNRSERVYSIASRVKDDGSYRKPATMSSRNTLFGNRIEHVNITTNEFREWLHEEGDRSRMYAVWQQKRYCYSMLWQQKKWRRV